MKRLCVVLVLLFTANALCAQSDDASKRARVEELFTVMRLDRTMQQVVTGSQQQAMNFIKQMPGFDQMTVEQKRVLDSYEAKITALVDQAVGWKVLEPDMVRLYSEAYSVEEINGLIAFYKSPVGQTMLDKTPELTTRSLELTQQRAKTIQPQIQALMMDMIKELSGSGALPTVTAPPPPPPPPPGAPNK